MHCTVQPGKYCTFLPPLERRAIFPGPLGRKPSEKLPEFCGESLVMSRRKIQFLVVGLQTDTAET